LIRTVGCRWAKGSGTSKDAAPQEGDGLAPGRKLLLTSGLAEIVYQTGVVVLLQGPATMEIGSKTSADIRQGRLTVRVIDPELTGFVVQTPSAKYTDLGTEFGVYVAADGKQEMHVIQGTVKVEGSRNLHRQKD